MSKIEWTDVTWNPIRRVGGGHACEKVSPGCKFCYAERMQPRFGNEPGKYDGKGEIYLDERVLEHPLRWKKPRMVFVCSMSDLFWEKVSHAWINRIFSVMGACPQHTFQVLTKRADRMWSWFDQVHPRNLADFYEPASRAWPLPNVWGMVSAENQKYWDERVQWLVKTPFAVRGVSCEPLLEQIQMGLCTLADPDRNWARVRIHWIIAGGESGPGARPSHPDWFRSLRDQCQAAGVKYFFKQWGDRIPFEQRGGEYWASQRGDHLHLDTIKKSAKLQKGWDLESLPGVITWNVKKKWAGRLLDGREWSEFPVASERKC